jgi:hypothetical protein
MAADFFDTVRGDIVAFIHGPLTTEYPELAVVYDNGPFDWNNPPALFLQCNVIWDGGDQINLALRPKTRYHGLVELTVHAKVGTGVRPQLQVLGWLAEHLGYKNAGLARLQAPRPDPVPVSAKGWAFQSICVPFHCDTQ